MRRPHPSLPALALCYASTFLWIEVVKAHRLSTWTENTPAQWFVAICAIAIYAATILVIATTLAALVERLIPARATPAFRFRACSLPGQS